MANTIIIKRSSTVSDVPTAGQLVEGELAIATNPADRKLYSKDSGGTVFEIGAGGSGDVTAGTHADTRIAVWTSTANEIEGISNFTFDGSQLNVPGTLVDLDNSGAATAVSMMARNSAGGVNINVATTSGDGNINQISGAGAAEDTWIDLTRNAQVGLRYNNNTTFESALYTASDFGTGAKTVDGLNTMRPVGFNIMPVYEIDVDDTFDLAHNGMMWHRDAGTAVNFTCNSDTTIPVGATYVVHNEGTDSIEITAGTATVQFISAGGAPVSGSVTVDQGGIVTVYKYTDGEFWVWGAKASFPVPDVLDDLSDVVITSAATGDLLRYNGGSWVDYPDSNYADSSHFHTIADVTDINATASELNKLDISAQSPTAGWALIADSSTVASWQALPGAPSVLDDLDDVTITTPADASLLIYDTGTATWRDFIMSGDASMNDSGVVVVANDSHTHDTIYPRFNTAETITGVWDFTTNPSQHRFGIGGDYSSTGAAGTWGATIWSLDTTWKGATAGVNSASTSVYGVRWFRPTHTEAHAWVGEGMYGYANGTQEAGFGDKGIAAFNGNRFSAYSVGNDKVIQMYHNDTDAIIAATSSGALSFTTANKFTFDDGLLALQSFSVSGGIADDGQVGIFGFMDVSGGICRFGAYNYDTVLWQPLEVHGSVVEINSQTGPSIKFQAAGVDIVDINNTGKFDILGYDVQIRDAATLRIYDSTDTDYIQFAHDGTDANTTFGTTTDWNIGNASLARVTFSHGTAGAGIVDLLSGNQLRIWDQGNADRGAFDHDGTDFNMGFTNTTDLNITGATNYKFDDSIFITEKAAANADVATLGQYWVLNNAPNDAYFTTDTGRDYPLGYAVYRLSAANVLDNKDNTETIGAQHVNGVWHKTTTTARTLTLETSSGTNFPVGAQLSIYNRSTSGNMTVTDTTTQTLWFLDGTTAVDSVGGVVIGPGGYATLIRESTTIATIMGAGIS